MSLRTWLALAAATAALYWAAFTRPFPLVALLPTPALSLSKLTDWSPLAALAYFGVFVALWALYLLAYRHAERYHARRDWLLVLAALLAFNAILLWMYPIEASDIFDNIMRGRLSVLYGENPFYAVPFAHDTDPVYAYIAWRDVPSAYGPLWEALAAALVRLAGTGLLAEVLVFKLTSIAAYAGCLALIAVAAPRERALAGVVLFGWCPLVLYTTAGSGHNDTVMLVFVLLGAWLLVRGRGAPALWALALGALIKLIPVLVAPLVVAHLWRRGAGPAGAPDDAGGRRSRPYAAILGGLAGAALLAAVAFAPYWQGGDLLGIQRRAELFTTSAPAMLRAALIQARLLDESTSAVLVSRLTLGVLAVATLLAMRAAAGPDPRAALRAGRDLLLFYVIGVCLWVQPWYVTWPLALGAVLPEDRGTRATLLAAFLLMNKGLLFEFVLRPRAQGLPEFLRELVLAPVLLGPVWLYWLLRARKTGAA
jgi:ABC-type multidrug transport system fused ATPase/permease subunit